MKMEQTECSERSAYKIQMLGNYPEENIQKIFCYSSYTRALYKVYEIGAAVCYTFK